jgi:hypothetical protein
LLDGIRDDDVRYEVEFHKELETIDEAVFQVVKYDADAKFSKMREK